MILYRGKLVYAKKENSDNPVSSDEREKRKKREQRVKVQKQSWIYVRRGESLKFRVTVGEITSREDFRQKIQYTYISVL